MSVSFCDLPDAARVGYRDVIDRAGGDVQGYQGESVQVAIPRPVGPFLAAVEAAGLELVGGSMHLFPLGSDNPPESMRHDGSYPGSRGFWLYARFRPTN